MPGVKKIVKSFYVDARDDNRMEITRPSADLKDISKDANGNLVFSINIPEDNMETDINLIVTQNLTTSTSFNDDSESECDEVDSQEHIQSQVDIKKGESSVIVAIKNQIRKYFKHRNEISKNSWKYWHDIPTDSKNRSELRVICQTCSKITNRKRALDHVLTHMNTYLPFTCTLCEGNSQFRNWRLFEKHFVKQHHDFYEEQLTKCPKCNKTLFIRKHTCAPAVMPVPRPRKSIALKTSSKRNDIPMCEVPDSSFIRSKNKAEQKPRLSSTGIDLNKVILETDLPDMSDPTNMVVSYQFDQF